MCFSLVSLMKSPAIFCGACFLMVGCFMIEKRLLAIFNYQVTKCNSKNTADVAQCFYCKVACAG